MNAATILAAEFTTGSKRRASVLTLNIIANGERQFVREFAVTGKREARQLAARHSATPWNF